MSSKRQKAKNKMTPPKRPGPKLPPKHPVKLPTPNRRGR